MNKFTIFFLIQVLTISIVFSEGSGQNVVLQWEKPFRIAVSEERTEEGLFFEGAVFNDTLNTLPFYIFRGENTVPFFRNDFFIESKEFIPVSPIEHDILKRSGFKNEEIKLSSGIEHIQRMPYSYVGFYPFRFDPLTGQFEKLASFDIVKTTVYDPSVASSTVQTYAENSVLAEGSWYKVCVDQTGIYRLDYNDLVDLGVNVSGLQKNNIRLFGNGSGMLPEANEAFRFDDLIENAVYVSGDGNSAFGPSDYILFYGRSPNEWVYNRSQKVFDHKVHSYSNENCYYLTTNQGSGKRITDQQSITTQATHEVKSFQDYAYHQQELVSLLNSGRFWYGEVFDGTLSRTIDFSFPDIDPTGPARIKTHLAARSSTPSSFTVRAGNDQMTPQVLQVNLSSSESAYGRLSLDSMWFTPNQANNVAVSVTYNRTSSGSRGWLGYIAINVTRHLRMSGSQLAFRNTQVIGNGNIAQYTLANAQSNVTVWDVTDRFNIRNQQTSVAGGGMVFRLPADSLREFVAFNGSSFFSPKLYGKIPNQNLHAMQMHDLVIVSPDEFISQANKLASFREENDGLSVAVVTPQQVYNEFSSGSADPTAIRNFMKMFYDRAENIHELPRYLLLLGNGTVDNKDRRGFGGNHIPTYQSLESLNPSSGQNGEGTHMTDDYYGLLDDSEGQNAHGIIDLGIGRLPVRTAEDAEIMVNKIIRYDQRVSGMEPWADNMDFVGSVSNYADWRNLIVLVADDGDNNLHFRDAESIARHIDENHKVYNVDKIYLDAYTQIITAGGARYPEVNRALNERVNQGALMINWIGHGGVKGLADERILTFDDIALWNNYYNMPVLVTATCEFSSFDQPDPNELSAGVRIALKPDGGAISLYTTTRLAWAGPNLTLNSNLMKYSFMPTPQGKMPRQGDMIRIAKQESSASGTLGWRLRNFVLLGDPSMQMALPELKVITQSMPDTIKALQKVTVSGYVADASGNIVSDYQGVVFPTIYDKKIDFRTLGNDPRSTPADFTVQNSLIYKGKASVVNGEFTFSFEMPRDIAYNYGRGKISYYLDNGLIDGNGYYDSFIIGGTSDSEVVDNTGPELNLFMNDTTFISGGTTNQNPILLAVISDESGINLTGRVGHDIVAFLNNDFSKPIVLNHYYQADLDTYQTGRVVYPFVNLADGPHTLTMRVWDIHNNPAVESLDFIVQSSAQLALLELINYPNPFSYHTNFVFSHNQPFEELDVQIDIFDLSGRLMTTIKTRLQSAGFQSQPVSWDGNDMTGSPLGNGMYIYRLTLTSPSGKVSQQTEKLVIVR